MTATDIAFQVMICTPTHQRYIVEISEEQIDKSIAALQELKNRGVRVRKQMEETPDDYQDEKPFALRIALHGSELYRKGHQLDCRCGHRQVFLDKCPIRCPRCVAATRYNECKVPVTCQESVTS